jgi:5-methylcytosine-specific restriction endonuclease McrA
MRNCFYCGQPMKRRGKRRGNPLGRTEDHVLPRARGGTSSLGNIVQCHRKCNEDKADRTLEEYRALVAARKGIPPEDFKFPGESG